MNETIRFNEDLMIQPTCCICEQEYYTKAYGGDLEYCPRCKSLGSNYFRELTLLNLTYEARKNIIKEQFKREILNQHSEEN